jgi:alkylation response protein AidB-like acyl-CoA dehydrogenase
MAGELGLHGIHLPEACGGQGFGFLELGIACEETGRALLCGPWFSSACLAGNALLNVGDAAAQQRFLPGIAAGEVRATLALLDAGDAWEPAQVALEYRRAGDAFVLDGAKRFVTDGAAADLLLVAARAAGSRGAEGLSLLAVRRDAPGLAARPIEPLDPTRKLAHLELTGVRAELVGPEGGAAAGLARTLDQARVCLALESVGGAQRCLESAVAYARQRIQFGRPIGSFQAIKHRCAELLLEVECARSAAYWASWVASEQGSELPLAASLAKSVCDETYLLASADDIHVHGGIGVTWEASPHLYFKRATANSHLLGDPRWQRRRIAELSGF